MSQLFTDGHTMCSPHDIKEYVFAGNATFTLKSLASGDHMSFRLRRAKNARAEFYGNVSVWFVTFRTGGDAEDNWTYLGMVKDQQFNTTSKSRYLADSVAAKVMNYFLKHVIRDQCIPETVKLEVRHDNTCGRCGRQLTTPESIDRGIGPECERKMR